MKLDSYKAIGHIPPQLVRLTQSPSNLTNVDTFGFAGGKLVLSVNLGSVTAAPSTLTLQESDDDSTYTDLIAMSDATVDNAAGGFFTGSEDNSDVVFDIPLEPPRKRFYRINYVNDGGTNYIAATAFLFGRDVQGARLETINTGTPKADLYSTRRNA
jgi:flagellar basal body rod protein FlgG